MTQRINAALVCLFLYFSLTASATADQPTKADKVDQTPLGIKMVSAFPNLEVSRPDEDPKFQPVVLTSARDGSNRIFIATQQGVVYSFPNDQSTTTAQTFLDIEDRVEYEDKQNEEGLLGVAFHPDFKSNGHVFVYYSTTDENNPSVVSRFTVSKDNPQRADPDTEVEIMRFKQPFWNHNGGSTEFGPDGYLYIGLGDGGKANDTLMNGQNLQTWLGSILRIDVDRQERGKKYAIPADNPFANQKIAKREIYAYGLRNVWKLSFDRKTNLLYAADVGQNLWEEINIIVKGGNYGWNLREGRHSFGPVQTDPRKDLIEPIWEYDHNVGKSITGGHVYRGTKVPELDGYYLYADYVTGKIWALKYDEKAGAVVENRTIQTEPGRSYPIITFGQDEQGEVYCSDYFGQIYRFEAAAR